MKTFNEALKGFWAAGDAGQLVSLIEDVTAPGGRWHELWREMWANPLVVKHIQYMIVAVREGRAAPEDIVGSALFLGLQIGIEMEKQEL